MDRDGHSATIIGGVAGAIGGAAVAWWQGKGGREIAAAAVGGAVTGAMIGSIIDTGGASAGVFLAGGALAGATGRTAENAVMGRGTTVNDLAEGASYGMVGGMMGLPAARSGLRMPRPANAPKAALTAEGTASAEPIVKPVAGEPAPVAPQATVQAKAAPVGPPAQAATESSIAPITDPRRLLTAGNPTTKTLAQVRALRGKELGRAGEQYARELYGGTGERYYTVPPVEGSHPVTGTGGRFVDVPAETTGGRVLGGEVKTYNPWRTVSGARESRAVPLSEPIEQQVHKDLWLRRHSESFDPRWIFPNAPPSPELAALLERLRIVTVQHK